MINTNSYPTSNTGQKANNTTYSANSSKKRTLFTLSFSLAIHILSKLPSRWTDRLIKIFTPLSSSSGTPFSFLRPDNHNESLSHRSSSHPHGGLHANLCNGIDDGAGKNSPSPGLDPALSLLTGVLTITQLATLFILASALFLCSFIVVLFMPSS